MDDFKNQHNITKINPNKKVWTIEKIHSFFTLNKSQLIKDWYLIDVRDIYGLGNNYWNWYQAINRNYTTIEDFKKEVWIKNKQIELKWSKVNIDKFYKKHKKYLLSDGYLKSLSKLDKINKEYWRWYRAISQYSQWGYKNLLSFKIEHKLPLWKNTVFRSQEKIKEIIKDLKLFNKKYWKITYKKLKDSWYLFFKTKCNKWEIKGYKSFYDFCNKNKLNYKIITKWNKESIDNFYYNNENILIKNWQFIWCNKLCKLWNNFRNWYSVISSKRYIQYNWMKDFAKKHNINLK